MVLINSYFVLLSYIFDTDKAKHLLCYKPKGQVLGEGWSQRDKKYYNVAFKDAIVAFLDSLFDPWRNLNKTRGEEIF